MSHRNGTGRGKPAAAKTPVPDISFVTTSKGRLHHIQQTVPALMREHPDQIIVVDYDCPQGTGDWVEANCPGVQVVRIKGDPGFCLPLARNTGSLAAKTQWVCFIDADIRVQPGFVQWLKDNLAGGRYYRAGHISGKRDLETYGTVICELQQFRNIGSYDEAFRGWGGEDEDLYIRLAESGLVEDSYPSRFVEAISHEDDERTTFHPVKKRLLQLDINKCYLALKADLGKIGDKPPGLAERQALMKKVRKQFQAWDEGQGQEPEITVELTGNRALDYFHGYAISKKLILSVKNLQAGVPRSGLRPSEPRRAEPVGKPTTQDQELARYWVDREDHIYLHVVRQLCDRFAPSAESVLDVGSNRTPVLEWHRRRASRLVSLDLRNPYVAEGVESLTQDFLVYHPDAPFDLVTCLQVLEHVPDPFSFAQGLLKAARVLVVSVPYRWRAGSCEEHLHDPVDEDKMLEWFGRKPDYAYRAREINHVVRLIHVYCSPEPIPPVGAGSAASETDAGKELKIRLVKKAERNGNGCGLFAVVRNEHYFMPHFFRHYRALGVDRFLVYDDGSTDGTAEFLRAQPDCTVIGSEHRFADPLGSYPSGNPRKFSQFIKDEMPPVYFPDAWVVNADADEFLVLPPGFATLQELIAELERLGQTHATAPMVDFYPETLGQRNFPEQLSPFEGCPYFDAGPIYDWRPGATMPERLCRGIRVRLLERLKQHQPGLAESIFGHKDPKWWPKTWKVPLLRNGAGVRRAGDHELEIAPDLSCAVALAHFKFYPGLDAKIADALHLGQYYKGSEEYRFLHAALRELEAESLLGPESRRYTGPESLAGAGLL